MSGRKHLISVSVILTILLGLFLFFAPQRPAPEVTKIGFLSHFRDLVTYESKMEGALDDLAADINGRNLDLLIILGDYTEDQEDEDYRTFRRFLGKLNPQVLSSPGNHEVIERGKKTGYKKYLDVFDYKYKIETVNNVQILLIDTNDLDKNILQWLRKSEQQIDKDKFVLIAGHHRFWDSWSIFTETHGTFLRNSGASIVKTTIPYADLYVNGDFYPYVSKLRKMETKEGSVQLLHSGMGTSGYFGNPLLYYVATVEKKKKVSVEPIIFEIDPYHSWYSMKYSERVFVPNYPEHWEFPEFDIRSTFIEGWPRNTKLLDPRRP
jgi:3',5'-cyclic AMP phosphodiesterase CpdA